MSNQDLEFRCQHCHHLLAAELAGYTGSADNPGEAICPKCGTPNAMPGRVVSVRSENEDLEAAAETENVG
jgi:hypothetical protein